MFLLPDARAAACSPSGVSRVSVKGDVLGMTRTKAASIPPDQADHLNYVDRVADDREPRWYVPLFLEGQPGAHATRLAMVVDQLSGRRLPMIAYCS